MTALPSSFVIVFVVVLCLLQLPATSSTAFQVTLVGIQNTGTHGRKVLRKVAEAGDIASVSRGISHQPRTASYSARQQSLLLFASIRANDNRRQHTGRHHNQEQEDTYQYLATCIPGLSEVLAEELSVLGCSNILPKGTSAVAFTASTKTALSTLIWARTPHKIMELLASTSNTDTNTNSNTDKDALLLKDRDDLADFVRSRISIKELLGDGRGGLLSLSVQVMLNNPRLIPQDINHSHFTALTIKNALCDEVRDIRGDRPNVELDDPDVPLVAVLLGTVNPQTGETGARLSMYRQLHSGSLHKRGYRQNAAIHKAAMKESLAAGLLLHVGWPAQCQAATASSPAILMDPMAGSGSLLLEAAMIAADLAPGLMRIKCSVPGSQNPAVLRWKHDDKINIASIWRDLLVQATQRARNGLSKLCPSFDAATGQSIHILGNEIHSGALELLESSLDMAGLAHVVQVHQGDCRNWNPAVSEQNDEQVPAAYPWTVVTNPPWGERLTEDMHESWEALRVFVREHCTPGSEVWVLSGNPDATKHLGLRKSQSLPIKTGQHDLRWIQYVLRDKSDKESETAGIAPSANQANRSLRQKTEKVSLISTSLSNRAMANEKRFEKFSSSPRSASPAGSSTRKTSRDRIPRNPEEENEWLI